MKSAVGIFVKDPVAGRVKTRLLPAVPADAAATLYKAFVRDTIELVGNVACDARVLAYWPSEARASVQALAPQGFLLCPQEGGDLGERMCHFFEWCFQQGMGRVVVIGSDSPTLPAALVEEALDALHRVPTVVGPSLDGGYYLMGLSALRRELFSGIDWGTSRVLAQTVSRLSRTGEPFRLLAPWYDVDVPESLGFLVDHVEALSRSKGAQVPQATYRVIKELRLKGNG